MHLLIKIQSVLQKDERKSKDSVTRSRGETPFCMCCVLEFLSGKVVRSRFTEFQLPISIFGGGVACLLTFVDKLGLELRLKEQ